ncbi:MAG: TonB-dependent receptor domain-containing protein [Gemmatimonadales bacterium]
MLIDEFKAFRSQLFRVLMVMTLVSSAAGEASHAQVRPMEPRTGGSISGRVLAADGSAPLADALVTLISLAGTRAAAARAPSLRTSRDGRYRFSGLMPGKYRVLITHVGYLPVAFEVQVTSAADVNLSAALDMVTVHLAQLGQDTATVVTGRVIDSKTGQPVPNTEVAIEGTNLRTVTDAAGRFWLASVPPGPQTLHTRRIGYAPTRHAIVVPARGTVTQEIQIASSALLVPGVVVTADPLSRARGELGTASVVDREAIANQMTTSLRGVLELTPGVPVSPPGLDGVEQISLRSVPTSGVTSGPNSVTAGGPSAADLAAFGTLIILDGVPVSNNANLQRGGRSEFGASNAGGGIDLRRIPASTLERVEVIRGIPSARFGDLTQGVIVVDTRAGVVDPVPVVRYDDRTVEGSMVAGRSFTSETQVATATFDIARTRLAPGVTEDDGFRLAGQFAHRLSLGGDGLGENAKLVMDTRVDVFQLFDDRPEQPDLRPGVASRNRDSGVRVSERARLRLGDESRIELTAAVSRRSQRSFFQLPVIAGATPFTDRLTEGRSVGRFIGGQFITRLDLDDDPWLVFGRLEATAPKQILGLKHEFTGGLELRREWNSGPGFQFPIDKPLGGSFNGVRGFDRPRRADDVPPLAAGALYASDRIRSTLPGGVGLDVQAGLRLDFLNDGTNWFSGFRDESLEPRLNVQLTPSRWVRLRAGWGRLAKLPSQAQLSPDPQFFDLVNVNRFTTDPAERLAVITTFIRDPTNPNLGMSNARKAEIGAEFVLGNTGGAISVAAFSERLSDAVGLRFQPSSLLREHFDLSDSTVGTGVPPTIIEPAAFVDTVPILIRQPANNLTVKTRGIEFTAFLPQLKAISTNLEVQGAWIKEELFADGIEFGALADFENFQFNGSTPRVPFWDGRSPTGIRAIFTYRIVHHQPRLGLVVTGTLQHYAKETTRDVGASDTLSFAGFMNRDGSLVRIRPEDRTDPQFADLRRARKGLENFRVPADWLLSLQVSKTLPLDGRFSFYAFNALDRSGKVTVRGARLLAGIRFGVELTMPLNLHTGPPR